MSSARKEPERRLREPQRKPISKDRLEIPSGMIHYRRGLKRNESELSLLSIASTSQNMDFHFKGTKITSMGDFLCIGDYVSLYCVETDGFVFGCQSTSLHNGLTIYQKQDRDTPQSIPNPHVCVFQVCIQNRYKLNKKYRKCLAKSENDKNDLQTKALLPQVKMSADAENADNIAEQKRQQGKRVRYGEIIQLKHVFTGKYIHVSTTQGSVRDKNNMLISIHKFNAKHAQFRVQPRYKVKSEGDNVQIYDQIVLESVKSAGQCFHASIPWQIDHFHYGSELNLGIERTGFTLIKSFKPLPGEQEFLRGGSVIRLFHRELEAYLVTEGLFDDAVLQDVHLRLRPIDQINRPQSLLPSTSGLTYWQVEAEDNILNGNVLRWGQQIRLRHMVTRQYLCVNADHDVDLTNNERDPRAVFRLHPVKKEVDEIKLGSYARIEHELTGRWLHALKNDKYIHKQRKQSAYDQTLNGLQWDEAELRKISTECDQQYDDAFSLQDVSEEDCYNFNYIAGCVPFIKNMILDLQSGKSLLAMEAHKVNAGLNQIVQFLYVNGIPEKKRQKLLRNLRVLDLLMEILKFPLRNKRDRVYLTPIFLNAYDVLHTYMAGSSRKNALYMAKYMGFFYTQLHQRGQIGLNVAQMIMELIKDNRKVVDRLGQTDIDIFVSLLKKHKNYRYLDMLNVLCVCDGVALPHNQNYIADKWLSGDLSGLFLTDSGLNICRETRRDIIYISTNVGKTWNLLSEFCDRTNVIYCEEEYEFLVHQLHLLVKLCYGGNQYVIQKVTQEMKLLTWEQVFYSMRSPCLTEALRAQYCSLMIGLFIDVGLTRKMTDHISLTFIYDEVDNVGFMNRFIDMARKELADLFPELKEWITGFLIDNQGLVASNPEHNQLIAQVLRLVQYLIEYGYYGDMNDVRMLLHPLLNLLDGRQDKPVPFTRSKGLSEDELQLLVHYQQTARYEQSLETKAIVDVKLQAMEVMDLLLTYQHHSALEGFTSLFKSVERRTQMKRNHSSLTPMLYETFQMKNDMMLCKKAARKVEEIFERVTYFDTGQITEILMDLSNYKYDQMVTRSMALLNRFYCGRANLFKRAVRSQVLFTEKSCKVHREALLYIPQLRRLTKTRLENEQLQQMGDMFDKLADFCYYENKKDQPHPTNQTILINNGILSVIFDLLSQQTHRDLSKDSVEYCNVISKCLRCLMFLASGNNRVQKRIFERLDSLISIVGVEQELSLCLKQAFVGSESLCLKVSTQTIEKLVKIAADQREKAPGLLELLHALVKVEDLDLPLKRNQMYVMKHIMHNYHRVAYVIDQPTETREQILTNEYGAAHLRYMVSLVDLLATCAEGENRFIESLCQKFIRIEDLFWVLNHQAVDNNLKSPFLRYMLWVYMNTAGSIIESGAAELPHESSTWEYMATLVTDINCLTVFIIENKDSIEHLLSKPPAISQIGNNQAEKMRCNMHYLFDGVMPFLTVFFRKFYSIDKELYPDEGPIVDKLAHALMVFAEAIGFLITNPTHLRIIISCALSIVPQSTLPSRVLEEFLEKFGAGNSKLKDSINDALYNDYREYYAEEEEMNAKLHAFAGNFRGAYGGENTVAAQLKHAPKCALNREYTEIGGDEELPLGEEFQSFVQCFINPQAKTLDEQYETAGKLLQQLVISFLNSRSTEQKRLDQEELDLRCLQLLRAMIHNEERKLPDKWDENKKSTKEQLERIRELQDVFNRMEALCKVLPHVARQNDTLVREVLSFISDMLFNANKVSQDSLYDYFMSTREENFFFAIKNRMHMSAIATKEKRALLSQHRARTEENMAHAKSLQATMTAGRVALQRLQNLENTKRTKLLRQISIFNKSPDKKQPKKGIHLRKFKKSNRAQLYADSETGSNGMLVSNGKTGIENSAMTPEDSIEMTAIKVDTQAPPAEVATAAASSNQPKPEDDQDLQYRDDGYIQLVLKVLARICDGQFTPMQDYLREQPDNIKSFNLIAETVQYMCQVYANINPSTIDLINQLLESLNECVSGNEENRIAIFDNKIVDYINFILRTGQFAKCMLPKALELLENIGNLLMSLIEENHPDALEIAKEVADCLDKDALLRFMSECYVLSRPSEKSSFVKAKKLREKALKQTKKLSSLKKPVVDQPEELPTNKIVLPKRDDEILMPGIREHLVTVGFKYFFLFRRITDIAPKYNKRIKLTEQQAIAYNFFDKNSMSVEILKEGHLQRMRFPVENKNVLRDEVKEKLKWSVDRSSPSSKIRDLMIWSKDILKDIYYQRKVLSNKLAFFFMKFWLLWNYMCIFMSLCINIMMLVTWNAKATIDETPENATSLPVGLYDPRPLINFKYYMVTLYAFAGIHNVLSLFVVISYFLLNHPLFPTFSWLRKCCCKRTDDEARNVQETQSKKMKKKSKLDTQFLSFKTLYYLVFLGFSIAGTAFSEYFFCFHLLNIVNNNQLLARVISAVTLNGKSLLWVGVLGIVIFYIYALIAFAFFRSLFNPADNWYCKNLFQCSITIIRYGLVGDMFEVTITAFSSSSCPGCLITNMPITDSEKYFARFGMYVIFNISFFIFITTIGLNIIFGIIVDTFSELRDLKWTAERDMRDSCFVCSRSSYDFEHYGKGFQHHIRHEHNMWAYIFFFIHLADTKPTDYTALELYVYKLLEKENYDFFPLNRALCLTDMENDQQETKFDELLHYVSSIFHKQKEEELKKKHEAERLKQEKWEEEHRLIFYNNTAGGNHSDYHLSASVDEHVSLPLPPPPPPVMMIMTSDDDGDDEVDGKPKAAHIEISYDDGNESLDPYKPEPKYDSSDSDEDQEGLHELGVTPPGGGVAAPAADDQIPAAAAADVYSETTGPASSTPDIHAADSDSDSDSDSDVRSDQTQSTFSLATEDAEIDPNELPIGQQTKL
ncbi:inositol 1,4,5-trisphosphate-gated calcium channel ITPR3-like [Tubulanus polymorphus]|uniref:inositol 1,4,5-trisphosphate-gated calcium channel ITPR3-like n=1 Tax=Tubulanus polymorphus TaxID=672921 RepID=UPI003DA6A866